MRYSLMTTASCLLLIGCNSSDQTVTTPKDNTVTPNPATVRLHVDGFKKSKSGAT